MKCKICYKNETNSSSGICWECCFIVERYLVLKWKEKNEDNKINNEINNEQPNISNN